MRSARAGLLLLGCLVAGVAIGAWMASLTYACPAFCLDARPRFPNWQCSFVGVGVAAIALTVAGTVDRESLRASVQGFRNLWRFLFEDLTRGQVR